MRSWCPHVQVFGEVFLAFGWLPFCCVPTWQRERERGRGVWEGRREEERGSKHSSVSFSYKGMRPIGLVPHPYDLN